MFNQYLANNGEEIVGLVVYLAGLNLPEEVEEGAKLPPSNIFPCHLLLSIGHGIKRVYWQAELSTLLQIFPDDNPYMVNIESIISGMEIDCNIGL